MSYIALLALSNLATAAGIGLLLYLVPRMSRRDMIFGVTVDPEFSVSSEVADILTEFRRSIMRHTTFWMTATILPLVAGELNDGLAAPLLVGLIVITPFGIIIGGTVSYLRAHRKLATHSVRPTATREASLLRPPSIARPWIKTLALGPAFLVAATALTLYALWGTIPPRYPSHWGVSGKVDGWTVRAPLQVAFPLILAIILNVLLLGLSFIVNRKARRLYASGDSARFEQEARDTILGMIVALCYFITLPLCAVTLWLPLRGTSANPSSALILFSILADLAVLTIVAVLSVRASDAMENARKAATAHSGDRVIGDRTDDRFWKWGVLYRNADDPAIWVDKRVGVGWTLNMAHWQGWAWLIGFVAVPALIVSAVTLIAR